MSWEKVEGLPHYLEFRDGKFKKSYRVNFRKDGIRLVETMGEFQTPRKALKEADERVARARVTGTPENPAMVRCEDLLDEMVEIVKSKADATYKQKEIMSRVHLKPWLNANCAYAKDLNSTTWALYRSFKRRQNPTVTLKAHAEVFGGLCAYAVEKDILKKQFKLDYDRERDDFAEAGMVIPKPDLIAMLKAAPVVRPEIGSYPAELYYFEAWRDRIILQRATGMRPGEVRLLKKDRITVVGDRAIIRLRKEDTKTRQARPVPVKHRLAVEILKLRMDEAGMFVFPQRNDITKAMGPSLKGWRAILKRAGVNSKYTPHDLRHSYLSDMFKNSSNPALICFTCGLSLEEAQKTYLHFSEDDAMLVSDEAAKRLSFMGGK